LAKSVGQEQRARSRLPPAADFHSPRSSDSSRSFSSASSFIVTLSPRWSFVALRLGTSAVSYHEPGDR
jgi:hypothetical protein